MEYWIASLVGKTLRGWGHEPSQTNLTEVQNNMQIEDEEITVRTTSNRTAVLAGSAELPYGIVSVDDHAMEPPQLWIDRLPRGLSDRAPRVVREPVTYASDAEPVIGDVWHFEDVRVPVTRGFSAAGRDLSLADSYPTTFEEMRGGCHRVKERLEDMDRDGVEASVCFPNLFVRFCGQRFLAAHDKALASECVRAYNDWLAEEWCGESQGRLIASGIIPLWDVEAAAAEVRRNAARGFPSVCFSEIPDRLGLPSMYSGYWEPFFIACAETSTVINLHIGSSSVVNTTSADAPVGVAISNNFGNSSFALTDWLLCGAFVRHPDLKVALSEGQAGWIPYLMSRLDGLWATGNASADISNRLSAPPSSYLAGHVYTCVFDDPTAMQHLELIGRKNICFETDYPHPDGSWPNSVAAALKQTEGLSPQVQKDILRQNGAELYRIERVLAGSGVGSGV
jgi:predicted TIM-barrel fold metal-dependent hydrolase